jgi:hypothetical protein
MDKRLRFGKPFAWNETMEEVVEHSRWGELLRSWIFLENFQESP